eukprot:8051562-Alexandrium_andersonii.AAC.1
MLRTATRLSGATKRPAASSMSSLTAHTRGGRGRAPPAEQSGHGSHGSTWAASSVVTVRVFWQWVRREARARSHE